MRRHRSHQPKDMGRFRSDESRAQGEDTLGGSLPHHAYRALVVRAAGPRPDTRALYLAQAKVDAALGKLGTSIEIPGASPCRRTI